MRVIIADDEPLARKRLARILEEIPGAELVAEAANGKQAIQRCSEQHPDILLLDIRMPEMDGLEVARHLTALDNPPAIIFTTAFDSHAIAAFKTQAVGYLLKPVRKEHLQEALEKAKKLNRAQLLELGQQEKQSHARTHISIQTGSNIHLIPVHDIDYFQSEQKYTNIYYKNGETLIEEPLKDLEEEFCENFIRIHRSTLVAIHAISGIHKDSDNHYWVTLKDRPEKLEVSRRMASNVRSQLKNSPA